MIVDGKFLQTLYENKIFLSYNSYPPKDDRYGWLKIGSELSTTHETAIESNVGLYGGGYFPLKGGVPYNGFCSIGSFSYSYSPLPAPLIVGRYCSISTGLKFLDSYHPMDTVTTSAAIFRPNNKLFKSFATAKIIEFSKEFDIHCSKSFPIIGHDVWIGADVTLSLGIKIGTGSVIASGSVVTKDVPPYAVVAGNPAKVKKFRFDEEVIDLLKKSCWWDYDPLHIFTLDFKSPIEFSNRILNGNMKLFQPKILKL
jgi:acetyltransferase-like isoleucine patch superfamily enzyme